YEINTKRAIVCDPAIGQLSLTHKEFQANWTGYAFVIAIHCPAQRNSECVSSELLELLGNN
ncbi:hypothetical protein AMR41_08395, partial [Hapalosiphon sp. MRB220]